MRKLFSIARSVWGFASRVVTRLTARDLYDVGHGKGCACRDCEGDRFSREAW